MVAWGARDEWTVAYQVIAPVQQCMEGVSLAALWLVLVGSRFSLQMHKSSKSMSIRCNSCHEMLDLASVEGLESHHFPA